MMTMKENRTVIPTQGGFVSLSLGRRPGSRRLPARSMAGCAIVIACMTAAQAADPFPVGEPANPAAPAQKLGYSPQGYQMARYRAFARQAEMPAITAADKSTIMVGGTLKIDVGRLAQLSDAEKDALAGQFRVPAGVIEKLLQRQSDNPQSTAVDVGRQLRTAVVDYRFLQAEWERYHPPMAGQQVKADALQALQAGDLAKAWELYDGLRKPPAPSNPRIVVTR